MKTLCLTTTALMLIYSFSSAQEEDVIAVKARLEKSSSFHFTLGATTSVGQTNYRGGTLVGMGYQKRVNRIMSIGFNISYSSFRIDFADYMTGKYRDRLWNDSLPNNTYYPPDQSAYYLVNLSGGNLQLLNFGIPLKINFIPIKSTTVASLYGSFTPGIVMASLDKILVNENYISHPSIDVYSHDNNHSFEKSPNRTKWTGSAIINLGIEFFPTNLFTFYFQTGFGYSFPMPFVDTSLYQTHTLAEYLSKDFPLSSSKGFSTLNFQFGLAYNF